jgi:hypothetical protein
MRIKFGKYINEKSKNYNSYTNLLYAILIYENLNRPNFVRYFENLIVKITKKELTVGIAQVKSNKPLTDIQSIELACKRLANSNNLKGDTQQLKLLILRYNGSADYYDSVMEILGIINTYGDD